MPNKPRQDSKGGEGVCESRKSCWNFRHGAVRFSRAGRGKMAMGVTFGQCHATLGEGHCVWIVRSVLCKGASLEADKATAEKTKKCTCP